MLQLLVRVSGDFVFLKHEVTYFFVNLGPLSEKKVKLVFCRTWCIVLDCIDVIGPTHIHVLHIFGL